MGLYLAVLTICWLPAFYEVLSNRRARYGYLCVFYLALILTALRYETGYDWPVYLRLFEVVPQVTQIGVSDVLALADRFAKEMLFVFALSILKQVSSNFQIVIFFISLVLFFSFNRFLSTFSKRSAFVFAVSFSFLIFTLYFSVLRQALAVALFMLFMVFQAEKKYFRSIVCLILALAFQYSAILYLIIYVVANKWPGKLSVYAAMVLALLGSFMIDPVLSALAIFASNAGLGWIGDKLYYYAFLREFTAHWADKTYMYFSCLVLVPILTRKYFLLDGESRRICGMGLVLCIFELLFISEPIFRNRVYYLIFPMQIIIFFNWLENKDIGIRFIVTTIVFVMSISYAGLFLMKPNSAPFLPYQFWPYYQLTDKESTGKARTDKVYGDDF